jgi:hypothetical protein
MSWQAKHEYLARVRRETAFYALRFLLGKGLIASYIVAALLLFHRPMYGLALIAGPSVVGLLASLLMDIADILLHAQAGSMASGPEPQQRQASGPGTRGSGQTATDLAPSTRPVSA